MFRLLIQTYSLAIVVCLGTWSAIARYTAPAKTRSKQAVGEWTFSVKVLLDIVLCSRYVAFYRSLISSSKVSVRFLARLFENDRRTVLGRSLHTLCMISNVQSNDSLTPQIVKNMVKYFEIP